jgi:hypothetical protein
MVVRNGGTSFYMLEDVADYLNGNAATYEKVEE